MRPVLVNPGWNSANSIRFAESHYVHQLRLAFENFCAAGHEPLLAFKDKLTCHIQAQTPASIEGPACTF